MASPDKSKRPSDKIREVLDGAMDSVVEALRDWLDQRRPQPQPIPIPVDRPHRKK